ncbi:hypothetical protein [Pusillimonas sp. NJUB218]|uniref:hypothetical protein n=1 Tax=Pusillimonas sp. NJUB218 TaxID=2023230 RepID=UPI000F4AF749|nr:hypothetical protein [Pusillimonas sp. NJUB218]
MNRAFDKRRVVSCAPYSLSLYHSVIKQVKRQGLPIERLDVSDAVGKTSRVFFRHDIDYAGCVTGAAAMLELNLNENIPIAVFLRVDGEAYAPEDAAALVETYRAKGVLFGLHTSCYVYEDYLGALERERLAFLKAYGFEPKTFTVHGLGELHLARRLAFTSYAAKNLKALGFDYSDCTADLRPYHRVFQDCDRDPLTGERAVFSDMTKLPPLLRRGCNYLILTHPTYWVA